MGVRYGLEVDDELLPVREVTLDLEGLLVVSVGVHPNICSLGNIGGAARKLGKQSSKSLTIIGRHVIHKSPDKMACQPNR